MDVFPAEVNLVTRLLRQIRAKSAPDSWSLANTRMLYYVFRSAGQVLDSFSSLVTRRLIVCAVATPKQIIVSKHTLAMVCFRGVDLIPAE